MQEMNEKSSIWLDADACPVAIKEVLFRASKRTRLPLILVANHPMSIPRVPTIRLMVVGAGFDVADKTIVESMQSGDLVITSDIPLADEVLKKEGSVLTPRGEPLTADNIGSRLNIRDFMETMRASGIQSGRPPKLSSTDVKRFADQLDRWLAFQ